MEWILRLRAVPWTSLILGGVAGLALLMLARKGATSFDTAWDGISYHLPYAARHVGICGTDCYQTTARLHAFFPAFPAAANIAQGVLWYVTGTPEAAAFLNLGALVLLIVFLNVSFGIPWAVATLALLTIPVVQILTTSFYVDLAANVAASICALSLLKLALEPERWGGRALAVFVIALIFLGNSKTQMVGPAAAFGIGFVILINVFPASPVRGIWAVNRRSWVGIIPIVMLGLATTLPFMLNAIRFGNPVFPVTISVLGLQLPGIIPVISWNSVPEYLVDTPGAIRWLLSVVEFSAFDQRVTPWTLGQGDVPHNARSFRMGGYFGAYVLLNVIVFAVATQRLDPRRRRIIRGFMVALTVLTAVMPAAHELRYYIYWMICLVAGNLYVVFSKHLSGDEHSAPLRNGYLAVIVVCFAYVVLLSGGRYFLPNAPMAKEMVVGLGMREKIEKNVRDGDVVCVNGKMPFSFLYAQVFHPGRKYRTIENGRPEQCNVFL